MRYILAFLFCIISTAKLQAQATPNYIEYHDLINRAETCMFLKNNYDSAKRYYTKAFDKYDFCFVKDCFTAAELAAYNKDKDGFQKFILKAFEMGFKLQYLGTVQAYFSYPTIRVTVFDEYLKDARLMNYLRTQYPARRAKYLARINKGLRTFMHDQYIKDQVSKNNQQRMIPGHPEYRFSEDKFVASYKAIIEKVGFPLEKIVGVEDSAMVELEEPEHDLRYMYEHRLAHALDSFNVNESQFRYDEPNFDAHFAYIPLLHNSCSYNDYMSCYQKQIELGNIHPREVAYLAEHWVGAGRRKEVACKYDNLTYNITVKQLVGAPSPAIDRNRAAFHIVPLEVDLAKKKFAKEHSIRLFYGSFDFL